MIAVQINGQARITSRSRVDVLVVAGVSRRRHCPVQNHSSKSLSSGFGLYE